MRNKLVALVLALTSGACTPAYHPIQSLQYTKPLTISEGMCEDYREGRPRLYEHGGDKQIAEFDVLVRFPTNMGSFDMYVLKVYDTNAKKATKKILKSADEKRDLLNSAGYNVIEIIPKRGNGKATIHFGQEISRGIRVAYTVFDFNNLYLLAQIANEFCDESPPIAATAFGMNLLNLFRLYHSFLSNRGEKYTLLPYIISLLKPRLQRVQSSEKIEEIDLSSIEQILKREGFTKICMSSIEDFSSGEAIVFTSNKSKPIKSQLLAEAVARAMHYFTERKGIELLMTSAD